MPQKCIYFLCPLSKLKQLTDFLIIGGLAVCFNINIRRDLLFEDSLNQRRIYSKIDKNKTKTKKTPRIIRKKLQKKRNMFKTL